VLLPVRATAVLFLAIAAGAMVPRQLPALLLAGAATLALFVAMAIGIDAWMAAEAGPIPMAQLELGGPRVFDMAFRDNATGKVISMNDLYNRYGDIQTPDRGAPAGFNQVAIGISGDQYAVWVLRESALVGVLALASVGLAALTVQRRRPG